LLPNPRILWRPRELLSKGANLNTISNLISREISPEQIGLLNDMIQAAQTTPSTTLKNQHQPGSPRTANVPGFCIPWFHPKSG
jgi:hypothetical protein